GGRPRRARHTHRGLLRCRPAGAVPAGGGGRDRPRRRQRNAAGARCRLRNRPHGFACEARGARVSVALCALTDADRSDIDGWLARAERELATVAVDPPQRVVDTSSALLLHASFKPGQATVQASLTLYRDHGRVRVDLHSAADHDAAPLESWLVEALELTVAAR